ncbi:hypothetical protein CDV36_013394 [Fusarium kuroshium]|uniref:Uncharacterized protein n=1 Tax=Fusarium kuroshium TaxID=2010991 RepID=A0A3M2RNW5_9HYPO|nr:hypothetical protein CDV36_013394 [Fusarium kuroshium]
MVRYAGLEKQNEPSDFLGPGMYVLAAGVLVKFLAIAGVFIGFLLFGFISLVEERNEDGTTVNIAGGRQMCGPIMVAVRAQSIPVLDSFDPT